MKKILVPVDFSELCEYAVEFAIDLAEKNGTEILLLNSANIDLFHDYQYSTFSTAQTLMDDVAQAADQRMARFMEQFKTEVKMRGKVSHANLLSSIKDEIAEEGIDLVVMGTKGSSGIAELFIGSNTERIVRHVSCPVISVPGSVTVNEIKKVMVPLDLREIRGSFFDQIAKLQKYLSCELEFVWVKTPHNIENEEVVTKELAQLFDKHGIDNYKFAVVNNIFPLDGILLEAMDSKSDMVAMATHARRGISHWLAGSLTEDTVNHVEVPVWTFRMDKSEKVIKLNAVTKAKGTPDYKKLDVVL